MYRLSWSTLPQCHLVVRSPLYQLALPDPIHDDFVNGIVYQEKPTSVSSKAIQVMVYKYIFMYPSLSTVYNSTVTRSINHDQCPDQRHSLTHDLLFLCCIFINCTIFRLRVQLGRRRPSAQKVYLHVLRAKLNFLSLSTGHSGLELWL